MKAAQINSYGGPEVIEINENAPIPKPAANQILVKVLAASINPFDGYLRLGGLKEKAPLPFPITLGGDFAGEVAESESADYKIGDGVFGSALVLTGGSGSFAEHAVANLTGIALKPKSIDFLQAASLPLVGSSAVQAIEEHIKLNEAPSFAKASAGQRKILIHGGAGGIGSIAIQIAKSLGAYVATTVSANNIDFARQLGADQVIDYKTEKFEEILKDFDAVYDTVGGETRDKSFLVLKHGGVLLSMLGQPNEELAKKYGVIAIGQGTKTNTQHLTRLAELVDSGKVKPQINKVFTLEQTKTAFEYREEKHPHGKVVLSVS